MTAQRAQVERDVRLGAAAPWTPVLVIGTVGAVIATVVPAAVWVIVALLAGHSLAGST